MRCQVTYSDRLLQMKSWIQKDKKKCCRPVLCLYDAFICGSYFYNVYVMKCITNLNKSERLTGRDDGPIPENPLSSHPILSHLVCMFWRRVRHIQDIRCEWTFKPSNSESASVQVYHRRSGKCSGRIEEEATVNVVPSFYFVRFCTQQNHKMFGAKDKRK